MIVTNAYQISENIRFHKIHDDLYIAWNRFFPMPLKLNKKAYSILKCLKQRDTGVPLIKITPYKDYLDKYGFLNKATDDVERFYEKVDDEFAKVEKNAEEFYARKLSYPQLYIYNEPCNLKCFYCARHYKRKSSSLSYPKESKRNLLFLVVNQYMERKVFDGVQNVNIAFNGGEILLEWELIKEIVERNTKKYPQMKFQYYVNTNLTLMTEEIAKFMNKYDFNLDISIDGYEEAHNLTRKYHNGKGSFSEIIKALEIYRKYNPKDYITEFQGTIENPDSFIPEKVFEMNKFGFKSARLAPNLLNISEEDAREKAKLMKRLLELSQENTFKVSDSYFDNIRNLLKADEYKFYFSCNGLRGLPMMGFHFNLTSISFSHVCDYVSLTTVSAENLNFDIYNPELWEVSRKFILNRINTLKTNCRNCDIIGICKGDCVMFGLDNENQINKAACTFQNEMWRHFLNYIN